MLLHMKVGIGQDSHRFGSDLHKPFVIGGIVIDDVPGMDADSDGDVVLHALCNAITSITHVPILGGVAIKMCHEKGVTNSAEYLMCGLQSLNQYTIEHIAFSVEAGAPRLQKHVDAIRENVAQLCGIDAQAVGMTVTSGDGMTPFGQKIGVQCFCMLTVS